MGRFNEPQMGIKDYAQARYLFWQGVYRQGGMSLYARQAFQQRPRQMNIEHIFPMSWVMNDVGYGDRDIARRYSDRFNQIEGDLHNMYPSDKTLNRLRGSANFGEIKRPTTALKEYQFELDADRHLVEPHRLSRGNIARAMFYMADAYEMRLFKRQKQLLQKWHKFDPPSERERQRNQIIEKLQGNRNHFIDYPRDAFKL